MPSMNLPVPNINGYFDSTILSQSYIYPLGGGNICIQVTKKNTTDDGTVSLLVTNHPESSDDWLMVASVSVGDTPVVLPAQFAYFKIQYHGCGVLGCCYSD